MIDLKLIQYLNERAENIKRSSIKLSDAWKEIDEILTPTCEKVGIVFVDNLVLHKTDNEEDGITTYKMRINKAGLSIQIDRYTCDGYEFEAIHDMNRTIRRKAIKRLPEFMDIYAKELDKLEIEAKETEELAEKILNAIRAKPITKARRYKYGSLQ